MMAARQQINTLFLSLGLTVPLIIDLVYHEGYFVPTNFPGYWTQSRLDRLTQIRGLPYTNPPSLTYTRYRTESPLHAAFVHTRKSVWQFNAMWPFVAVVTSGLQLHWLIRSARMRVASGVFGALAAMGLTWSALVIEGHSRKMFLDDMREKVAQEEAAYRTASS